MEEEQFETRAIRIQSDRSDNREHSVPIYMTSSFLFDDSEQARALFADEIDGNIYTRFSNPNTTELVDKLCSLEGGEAGLTTSSGMAAFFTITAGFLDHGDHILTSSSIYGSTHQVFTKILPRWDIQHTYVDIREPETWEKEIRDNTKLVFVETPGNPTLDLVDLKWLGQLGKKYGIYVVVDNTMATPYLQKPIQYGADIVIHSASKYMDGQGRTVGGIIVSRNEIVKKLKFFARHTGPCMSPFNAWVISKSLETLPIRMERHSDNAHSLAMFLEKQPEVESVYYPFLNSHPQQRLAKSQMKMGGGLVTFIVKGGLEQGKAFVNSLNMISRSANLGDSRTIATHPASSTYSRLLEEERLFVGIDPGLIRISAGLEHIDDIIRDVAQALKASVQVAK